MKKCSVDSCDKEVWARGFCTRHLSRFKKYGHPTVGGQYRDGRQKRFAEDVAKMPKEDHDSSCVVWPFAKLRNGYGTVGVNGKTVGAHAYVLSLVAGPRPAGFDACHSCGNRACINPAHLRWGTRAENMADAIACGSTQRGEKHKHAKLTKADVLEIRNSSENSAALARKYGVSYNTIYDARRHKNWKWLK